VEAIGAAGRACPFTRDASSGPSPVGRPRAAAPRIPCIASTLRDRPTARDCTPPTWRRGARRASVAISWGCGRSGGRRLGSRTHATRSSPIRHASSRGGSTAPSGPRPWLKSKKKWRRCWGRRWAASNPDGHGDRGRAPARHRADVRGIWVAASHLLPEAAAPTHPAAAAALASRPPCRGAGCGPRGAPRAAVRGPGSRGDLRDPPRRGAIPLLRADDVSPPGRLPRGPGAPGPTPASPLRGAGTPGPPAQGALELAHHQAPRAGQVDLLLPVRHAPTATSFSPGTTPSTIMPASACSRPRTCIMAWPRHASRRGRPCSPRPMPRIRNASSRVCPICRRARRKCGSIPHAPKTMEIAP
jgi:hypothetical protein